MLTKEEYDDFIEVYNGLFSEVGGLTNEEIVMLDFTKWTPSLPFIYNFQTDYGHFEILICDISGNGLYIFF